VRRLVLLTAVGATTAATLGAASAAPQRDTVSHANNRVCAAPTAGTAACTAIRHDTYVNGKPAPTPAATTSPSGFNPADLQAAYKLPSTAAGSGRTVAIVDAYDLPTALNDVNVYRSQFGLPGFNTTGPTFTKINQTGGSTPPAVNASWGQEIALDIDMVSAICPNCNLLLVEANSASFADLSTAVNTAAARGAVAISNSYGGSDSSAQSAYDHAGIAITASTGDNGYGVESPASYPTVTAVGGTALSRSTNTRGWSETAWSGAGSGCSRYNAKPAFQSGVNTQCSTRAIADVSAVADPNTGVSVYDSTSYQGFSGWMVFGGTSVSSPIIGSVYALAGGGYGPGTPYTHTSSLNDVTSGKNGHCNRTPVLCTAGTGWDGPTGLGTPNGVGAF
jgi:subtilase family serine protease